MHEDLIQRAKRMGIVLNEDMAQSFKRYEVLLVEWNEKINLTAITNTKDIEEKHFLDSLTCLKAMGTSEGRVIDIGTGAGFPGIPIKIAQPQLNVTLLDSLKKRVNFLNDVIDKLGLQGISAVHDRAEELARNNLYREQYDYAFARAVARLNVLCEYCIPFVKPGGCFVSQKSMDFKDELGEAEACMKKLGAKVEEVIDVEIPGTEYKRVLIIIRKTSLTDRKYPRHFSKIDKNPL